MSEPFLPFEEKVLMGQVSFNAIRIVVYRYKRNDNWIAQCLEYDLATQAPTLADIHREIRMLLLGHIAACKAENMTPFEGVPKAPDVFFKMWDAALSEIKRAETTVVTCEPARIPPVELPEPSLRVFEPKPGNGLELQPA